jgi:predicted dehydrogenase
VSDLRVAIAGFGLAGEVFHAPLIDSVDGLELATVMTRSPERAARAEAAYPGVRIAADVDSLLDGADLLVVATPNSSHVPLALAAIERDLPVVVDKPLAPSAEDGRRLLDAGGKLTVFQNRRYDGDFLTVKRLVADGVLGDVFRFESRFERFAPEVDPSAWREQADAAEGGGLVLDLGAHLVDQAVQLFGWPVAIYAEVAKRRPGAQVDDDVFIALEHEGGERSHLWMSSAAPNHGPRFRVSGVRGGFAVDGLDPQEPQLEQGMRPGDAGYGEAPPGLLNGQPFELERGRYEDYYAGVRDWARGETAAPVDPADSVRVLEILEAARRSADAHQVVRLEG